MIKITVGANDKDQRLDRFLRKYYKKATLSFIYKIIRKDVKVNGKRGKEGTILSEDDVISVYISEEDSEKLRGTRKNTRAKKQFTIAYEDRDVLIVNKPYGLLTHGDAVEKKNTLVNQVIDYLIETGEYNPRREQTFRPASVNRLDRNTTGLVIFGKTAEGIRTYSRLITDKSAIEKNYVTIVAGELNETLDLQDAMLKDKKLNKARVVDEGKLDNKAKAKNMQTVATPIISKNGFTFVKVRIITGRTHQIRLQLSHAGYPIIGDIKYGDRKINREIATRFGLTTQLLHCESLEFNEGKLKGRKITCPLSDRFESIKNQLFN